MTNLLDSTERNDRYECYLLHHKDGPIFRWHDTREERAIERLQKQAGWVQYRRSTLELHAPGGTIVGRVVKGIFEDYRAEG